MAAGEPKPVHPTATDAGTVTVSVREIWDVTYRLLCAAGVPAGWAARAAAMVQHAEVHHGVGLRLLHEQLGLVEGGKADPSGLVVRSGADALFIVDAGGGSVLSAGPAAMDLACGAAADRGVGIVRLRDAHGPSLLGELAYRAVSSEAYVCVVSWEVPAGWQEPLGHGHALIAGPGADGPIGVECASSVASLLLAPLLEKAQGKPGHKEARELAAGTLTPSDGSNGVETRETLVACVRLVPGARSCFEALVGATVEKTEGALIRTRAAREHAWTNACARGLAVDGETWSELYEMSRKMLVPEAEGSRS